MGGWTWKAQHEARAARRAQELEDAARREELARESLARVMEVERKRLAEQMAREAGARRVAEEAEAAEVRFHEARIAAWY